MDGEEKYLEIREKLRKLEPVKASDDFINKLHLKIVEIESEKRHEHEKRFDEGRGGFLRNLFGNMQYPWLVPAAGFTVLIFFIFYITYLNKNASENNKDLLSTQKQETSEQKNSSENKTPSTQTDPLTSSEPDKSLNEKSKLPGKDIASDLNTDTEKNMKKPSPVEDKIKFSDRDADENHKEELKISEPPKFKKEEEKFSNKKDLSEPEQKTETQDGKVSVESEQSGAVSPSDSEDTKRGILSKEEPKRKRLREKIDSVSKVDLDKLRKEILK